MRRKEVQDGRTLDTLPAPSSRASHYKVFLKKIINIKQILTVERSEHENKFKTCIFDLQTKSLSVQVFCIEQLEKQMPLIRTLTANFEANIETIRKVFPRLIFEYIK